MTTLRVLTYNVHGLRDDREAVARAMSGSGAHLVFVQEAPKVFRARPRAAALARRAGMVVVDGGGGNAAGNLLICSLAVNVHKTWTVRLPFTPGHQVRGAVFAELSLSGQRFTAVATHLGLDAEERDMHAARLLDEIESVSGPVIVGGDFNETAGGHAWERLAGRFTDVGKSAGADADPTFRIPAPDRRIDGFFVDSRVQVAGYEVLDSPDVRVASDHLPVYAELEL